MLGPGEIVQIVDPDILTQEEVLPAVYGRQTRLIRVPRSAVFLAGRMSEQVLGMAGRKSPVSEYRLRSALAQRSFPCERAERLLGWRPRVGVRAGIERVVREMSVRR